MMESCDGNQIAPAQPIGASGNKLKCTTSSINTASINDLNCLRFSKPNVVFYTLGSNEHATVIMGQRFNRTDTSPGDSGWKFRGDGGTVIHVSVKVDTTEGTIVVYRGDFGGTVLTTVTGKWFYGTWHHWEFKVTCNDTTGVVQIAIDGVLVVNLSGVDTKNGGADDLIDQIDWQVGSGDDGYHCRDIVVMNGAGSSLNDRIGPTAVALMKPNGAGGVTGWTPSTGANWQTVDEATISTADYVSAGSTALADTYATQDWPYQVVPAAIAVTAFAIAISGTMGLKGRVRRSSTNSDHATTLTPTAGYAPWQWVFEQDPIAAAAWTIANFNAAEFGMLTV